MKKNCWRTRIKSESGMTLIELSIAAVVLIVGMLSIMALLMVAIGNNGRSKIDSTATMLTQAVVEQVSADLSKGGPGYLIDNNNCDGTGITWTIDDSIGGAPLNGATINFASAPVAGYQMNFVECVNNVKMTYDVRWNVQLMATGTYLVTVGAKPINRLPTRFGFSIPVNMRVYVEQCPANAAC